MDENNRFDTTADGQDNGTQPTADFTVDTDGNTAPADNTEPQTHTAPPPSYTYSGANDYSAHTPSYNTSSYGGFYHSAPTPPPAPKKEKKRIGATAIIAICAVISLCVGAVSGFAAAHFFGGSKTQSPSGMTTEIKGDGTTVIYKSVTLKDKDGNDLKEQMTVGEVADMASSSVVEITTEAVATGSFMMQYVTEGAGSGVIISEDGYIATNHHVIADATKISVRTNDGTSYTARLVGSDEQTDLAVIKIEADKPLSSAIYGEYKKCKVGDSVVAIGNPLGELGGTVTDGIISALDRDVTIDGNIMTLMQTNTAINPGNSGGGLFNLSGQLIGIVNAKSSGEGIEGLGFAIPIDLASTVIEDLIKYGYVTGRKSVGIEVLEISDFQTAMIYRVTEAGLYVYSVETGSVADKAGLEPGALILEVNGKEVETEQQYNEIFDKLEIGDTLTLTVKEGRKEVDYSITVGEYKPVDNSMKF